MSVESFQVASVSKFKRTVPMSGIGANVSYAVAKGPRSIEVRQEDGSYRSVSERDLAVYIEELATGLSNVDCQAMAMKGLQTLESGISELDMLQWLMQTAAMQIGEEPDYSKLAARFL